MELKGEFDRSDITATASPWLKWDILHLPKEGISGAHMDMNFEKWRG